MSLNRVLADGLTACIPFAVVVWVSFLSMPRLWLHSLPADIQAMAPPKTAAERKLTAVMGTLVRLTFFGVPIALTWRLQMHEQNGEIAHGTIMPPCEKSTRMQGSPKSHHSGRASIT